MITRIPGSSDYYRGGVIAYANEVKADVLGVDPRTISEHGAVSEQVAAAMAQGARARLEATWAVSVTGIAGPTGGTGEKPVGYVCFGLAGPREVTTFHHSFPGARPVVQRRAALAALNELRLALI
jgi:nicotinamide-nucleotide amidase